MSLNARPAWERLNHMMTMPNLRQRRLWNSMVGLWTNLASKLHDRRWGVGCPNRQELQHARYRLAHRLRAQPRLDGGVFRVAIIVFRPRRSYRPAASPRTGRPVLGWQWRARPEWRSFRHRSRRSGAPGRSLPPPA